MWRRLASSAIAALALAASAAFTQHQRDSRLKTATTAITVDVVVRDQRGRPVTDLGRTLGETTLPPGTPDADGRIWHVSQLPLTSLTPGEYTLLVTLTAGADTQTRRTTFRVIE
jgi:hypothetical protein